MSEFLQHLVNMLVLGGTYALLGIGLTLIFGIMNVVNFTHGVLYTFGAYVMFIVVHQLGPQFLPRAAGCRRCAGMAAWARDRTDVAAAAARLRHRHHHAGDDRRLDRDAVRRARGSGAAWPSRSTTPFPEAPLVLGTGLGVMAAAVRACGRGAADRRHAISLINRTKLGMRDARDLSGSGHRRR